METTPEGLLEDIIEHHQEFASSDPLVSITLAYRFVALFGEDMDAFSIRLQTELSGLSVCAMEITPKQVMAIGRYHSGRFHAFLLH